MFYALRMDGRFVSSALVKTMLRYTYETKYRTATIMEEDALNQPSAQGECYTEL